MIQHKGAAVYYRAVGKELHCPKKIKSKILHALESDILEFIEEHPEATAEEVTTHFGDPAGFAADSLETMDADELQKELHKAKWIKRGIAIAVSAVILTTAVTAVYIIVENSQHAGYYYDDGVTQ